MTAEVPTLSTAEEINALAAAAKAANHHLSTLETEAWMAIGGPKTVLALIGRIRHLEEKLLTAETLEASAYECYQAGSTTPSVPEGYVLIRSPITEEMHIAASKVLIRASGLDGTPQRMVDAMIAAALTADHSERNLNMLAAPPAEAGKGCAA